MPITQTAGFISGHSSAGRTHQPLLPKALAFVREWLEARSARRRFYRDAQQLDHFSDRELWDLGLSRSDISSIAHGTYRRD
ncbi:MAG TPA: DUF1127 domain-containing protein [Rhodopila sp.]|nr:DUF1127 domain-containing protein [Rhodopila sp.]